MVAISVAAAAIEVNRVVEGIDVDDRRKVEAREKIDNGNEMLLGE